MARDEKRKAYQDYKAKVQASVPMITVEPRRNVRVKYTPELGEKICDAMVEEGSLKDACRRYWDEFPDYISILHWVTRYPDFDQMYSHARERLMERWAEDIVETSKDTALDPNERRIIIDTKKWLMSKLAHRRYGDKLQVSGDPDNPLVIMHKSTDEIMQAMSPVQLDALEQLALSMANATDAEEEEPSS